MSRSTFLKRILPQINLSASYANHNGLYPKLPITTTKRVGTKIWRPMILPQPGKGNQAFRRIVHFKDHYTIEPLNVTNLAGRDPNTGRLICKGIGGGIKHKFHQVKWLRDGPNEGPPKEEKVLKIFKDGCRTADMALVGSGNELKYIIASVNMKEGDIIRTSRHIPRMPVKPQEGDAHPLGALPIGTEVHCVEKYPGKGCFFLSAAGVKGVILRKDNDDRVVVRMPGKRPIEFSFEKECLAVVGQVSNVTHASTPIGSAQRNRELGNRPRSGLKQKKTGRHGRKIRPMKPVRKVQLRKEVPFFRYQFSMPGYNYIPENTM
ncbi:39S ribosomal protein L2, mitochondrial [Leptopilina boulardi]|uniref:39S ribosomal protein L2, mitochondrial n=1 Tax=Leptopilina boulardi TaxID=63433 RepID=UPI0021F5EC2D|nr:39S ribosomal protein L2, mitochondrial [Leptopilina boulardi]